MKRGCGTLEVSHGVWSHGIDQSESQEGKVLVFCRRLILDVSLISFHGFGIIAGRASSFPLLENSRKEVGGAVATLAGPLRQAPDARMTATTISPASPFIGHLTPKRKERVRETFESSRASDTTAERVTNTAILIPFPGLLVHKIKFLQIPAKESGHFPARRQISVSKRRKQRGREGMAGKFLAAGAY